MVAASKALVRIVYPSYPYKSEEHLRATLDSVRKLGIEVKFNKDAVDTSISPPYSHKHGVRAKEIIAAIEEGSPYIWVGAGGSGAIQVVSEIERSSYKPKTRDFGRLIGFSDATHLHGLWAKWGGISYHAPDAGLTQETDSIHKIGINTETTLEEMADIITGKTKSLKYNFSLISEHSAGSHAASIPGSLIGGNAQLLIEMQGSSTSINPVNRFIFIEDIASDFETDYLIRRLIALRRAGLFNGANAIFFGNLLVGKDGFNSDKDLAVLKEFMRDDLLPNGIRIPVLYSAEFGHGAKNRVLPFGTTASLALSGAEGILSISTHEPYASA